MMTDKERAQFEQWQKQWDLAAEQFAKEYSANLTRQEKPQPETSWLTNTPMDRDYQEPALEEDPSWQDIYNRSQEIDGLITEVNYSQGEKKPEPSFGGFTPTKTNPTQQSAIGPDQQIRVTPNWSDGEDLRELDHIKRQIEAMERKYHEEEVKSEKPSKLKKQLESLRDRVNKLSEKINREPITDVT